MFSPIVVFELLIILGTGTAGFPPLGVAAIFPLTLVFLVASPHIFRPGSYESPQAFVDFSKGARYAIWTITVGSFAFVLAFGVLYHQLLIGLSLLLIAFGSTPFPDISVASAYGYLLAKGEGVDDFFSRASRWPLSLEMRIIFWLSLFLWRRDLLKGLSLVGNYVLIPFPLYFLGWALLSVEGGFPATLLGVVLGLLVLPSSSIALGRRINIAEREKLVGLLSSKNRNLSVRASASSCRTTGRVSFQ